MELKEKVFMVDLIQRRYRRHVGYLIFGAALIIIGWTAFCYTDKIFFKLSLGLSVISIFLFSMTLGVIIALIDKAIKIKKAQYKALEEQYNAKADFEELICSVPLKEYFEV